MSILWPILILDYISIIGPRGWLDESSKNASEYYDPCQDFADRSLKCMKRNGFDREMCHDYFQYVKISNPGGLVAALKSEMPETIISGSFISSLTDSLTHRAYRDCKKNWVSYVIFFSCWVLYAWLSCEPGWAPLAATYVASNYVTNSTTIVEPKEGRSFININGWIDFEPSIRSKHGSLIEMMFYYLGFPLHPSGGWTISAKVGMTCTNNTNILFLSLNLCAICSWSLNELGLLRLI